MKILESKKLFLVVIILLTVLNLAFVITVGWMLNKHETQEQTSHMGMMEKRDRFMEHEIGFNEKQSKLFHQSRMHFRDRVDPLRQQLFQLNHRMIMEATSANPDTALCQQLCIQIGDIHTLIKQSTYRHMMEVRAISTPEQIKKLNRFYLEMFNSGTEHGDQSMHKGGKPLGMDGHHCP